MTWIADLVEVGPLASVMTPSAKFGPRADRLRSVVVERPEDWCDEERDDESGATTGWTADPDKFPPGDWAEALDMVLADPDGVMCAFAHMTDEASGQLCSASIGYVLHEDDDEPHRSGWDWRTVVLVQTRVGIVAVCEDDEPGTLYENALDNVRETRGFTDDRMHATSSTKGMGYAACGAPLARKFGVWERVTCRDCQNL